MWTIAGGILLALFLLIAIPRILVGVAPMVIWLVGIAVAVMVVIGGGYLLFTDREVAAFLIVGISIYAAIGFLQRTYRRSRNVRLFFAELRLRLIPALSLRKKAEKELAWEKHNNVVATHVATERKRLIDRELNEIRTLAEKAWRRYSAHGALDSKVNGNSVSFWISPGTRLFTVRAILHYPEQNIPKYSFQGHKNHLGSQHDFLSRLKSPMKKEIRAAVLDIERKRIREHSSARI